MLKNIYNFYVDGFKAMVVGKVLWKLIIVKLLLIFIFLNYFVYDKSIKTEYKTEEEKSGFVYKNLTRSN